MSVDVRLYDPTTGQELQTADTFEALNPNVSSGIKTLVVATPAYIHSAFKSVTRTGAGTSQIVAPTDNGSLIVNDILISGEKQNSSSVQVLFTDGTNTVTLFLASQTDTPAGFNHSFTGRVQGWRDARIDVTTVGTADATVTIVYTKVSEGLPYAEWDALR